MSRKDTRSDTLADLFGNRPGSRVEPLVDAKGKRLSVLSLVERSILGDISVDSTLLYRMPTDRELASKNSEELAT